jgi:carboxymethylenebutenolidase
MERKTAKDFEQGLLDLFDGLVHGRLSRREFLDRASIYAVGGVTAAALLEALSPQYALARQVAPDDPRISAEFIEYPSPNGHLTVRGLLAKPANAAGPVPGVVVIHENRGLNPYIEDVARRVAVAGFVALAPDGLTPMGGYPGTDDEGREMQRKLDAGKLFEDFVAAYEFLRAQDDTTDKVGAVGFCFGGGVCNGMAVRLPELAASVPFYGRQPATADVPKIQAPLLIHFAEHDERINAGWPEYEAALKENGKEYKAYFYPGTNHGFHNDTTPRYDAAAAKLAWDRTIEFFNEKLFS